MSAQIRELFDDQELDFVLEAITARIGYYESKAKSQAKGLGSRTVKAVDTLERYERHVEELKIIQSKWLEEMN